MKNKGLPKPRFLSVPEAAGLCGVTRTAVFNWVRQGKLKAYQTPGRTNLIRPLDLLGFMQASGMFIPAELADLAQADAQLQAASGAGLPAAPDSRPRILVVDDEPTIRDLLSRTLQDLAAMYQAETGFEALHLLTLHKDIRIILLDLHMPGQHGMATIREIRILRPDVQIVVVTGFEGEIPPAMLQNGTVARLVRKPFRTEEIHTIVSQLLAASGPPPSG